MIQNLPTADIGPQDQAALDQWENEGGRAELLPSPILRPKADEDVAPTVIDVEDDSRVELAPEYECPLATWTVFSKGDLR